MKLPSWSLPVLVLLADAHLTVAKAIPSPILYSKGANLNLKSNTAQTQHENHLNKRSPQNQQQEPEDASGSSSGSLKIGSATGEVNATVSNACASKMTSMTTVANAAGFAGCYNVLEFDPATTHFQSDLRIYTKSPPTGRFTGIAKNDILVLLNFPTSTSFKTLSKRAEVHIEERQATGPGSLYQQFSLSGSITTPLNIGKLSEVQLASLLTPQIKLQATSKGQTFSADMTTDDAVFFATGDFTNLNSKAKEVTDPKTATTAIAETKGFVLPGTTFGIFPMGLIVTGIWAVMFVLAYGAGTIARIHFRNIYRQRVAMMAGSSYRAPGMGKL